MKRKQFVSKLAALSLTAMMTATVIPASAISAFAGTATDTTSPTTTISAATAAALKSGSEQNDGKDLTASDIDKLLAGATTYKDSYTCLTQSLTKTKAAAYNASISTYEPAEYTGTVNVTDNTSKATETVSFTFDRTNYSNQDQLDAAASYISSQFDGMDTITSSAKDSTIKNYVNSYLSTFNATSQFANGGASLNDTDVTLGSVNITTNDDSTIAGTVTLNIDDPSSTDASVVLSKTVSFSIAKEATVPTAPESATASEFAKAAVATLADYEGFTNQNVFGSAGDPGDPASGMTTTAAKTGISAALNAALGTDTDTTYTISGINIINVTPAAHATPGSVQGSFTVMKTGTTDTANVVFTASIQHSFADIAYEAEQLATTALAGISNTDIQPKNADTAVTQDDADDIVKAALDEAFAEDYDTGTSVASELGKYEITSTLTAPTADATGTYTVSKITYTDKDDDDSTADQTVNKSYTLAKLRTIYATAFELGADREAYSKVTVTPTLTPSNATKYYITYTLTGTNAAKMQLDKASETNTNEGVTITANSGAFNDADTITATLTATLYTSNGGNKLATDTITVTLDKFFIDVPENKFYYDAVKALYDEGSVHGTTENTYSPDDNVTRGQFITILYNHYKHDNTVKDADAAGFTDVAKTAFYYDAVNWAYANGITAGTTATTFSPDAPITRGQAVQMLYKLYGKGETYTSKQQFTDVPETAFYADAVSWAVNKGVTYGKNSSSTLFAPDDLCTRGQAATFITKAD